MLSFVQCQMLFSAKYKAMICCSITPGRFLDLSGEKYLFGTTPKKSAEVTKPGASSRQVESASYPSCKERRARA